MGKLVSVFSFSNFRGGCVVDIVFGECAIVFQSKHCDTNPVSILFISPMTDKKPHIIPSSGHGRSSQVWEGPAQLGPAKQGRSGFWI